MENRGLKVQVLLETEKTQHSIRETSNSNLVFIQIVSVQFHNALSVNREKQTTGSLPDDARVQSARGDGVLQVQQRDPNQQKLMSNFPARRRIQWKREREKKKSCNPIKPGPTKVTATASIKMTVFFHLSQPHFGEKHLPRVRRRVTNFYYT